MPRRILLASLSLPLLSLFATPATGQGAKSNTTKLFLGAELTGGSISSDEFGDDSESGAGLSLRIGYGFTSLFSIFLEGSGVNISADGETWVLGHGDLGARFHFSNERRSWAPFVEAAFTTRTGTREDFALTGPGGQVQRGKLEISGGAFTVGGGVLFFFGPKLALSTALKVSSGEFDTVTFNNVSVSGLEVDATSARVNVGLSWFPMRRQ